MNKLRLLVVNCILVGFLAVNGNALGAAGSTDTQTVSGGGVTVSVTYTNPRMGEAPRFDVAVNTHSVDLDGYDFNKLTVLRAAGKIYAPTKVENKGGGHHRRVALTFPKISEGAKRVEVIIKDIAGVKERTFRWELN